MITEKPIINVYGLKSKFLGIASSFGAAKRLQLASLPDDLEEYYGGIQDGRPLFHIMPDDLATKYDIDQ